jgi:hypothetical protein
MHFSNYFVCNALILSVIRSEYYPLDAKHPIVRQILFNSSIKHLKIVKSDRSATAVLIPALTSENVFHSFILASQR